MGTLEKAMPGRQNAKDWLTLKIVECLSEPMDDKVAGRLETYNAAYNAICQWDGDQDEVQDRPKERSGETLSMADAKAWTAHMTNADGTNGPHWNMDQVKQIMAQRKLSMDPIQFWTTINMLYSDFGVLLAKHGPKEMDAYVELVRAFLDDPDAAPNKMARYYRYIAGR